MAELTVDFTYGQALFEAARELDKVDLILEEGEAMANLFQEEPELMEFVATPTVAPVKKKAAIGKIFDGRVSPELVNLLYVLVDKGRGRHFGRIIRRYKALLDESKGFALGTIYSVNPLTPEQLQKFEASTGKLIKKQVHLENKIDPALIGGVKVLIEGKIIDASVKTRLVHLGESIK